MGKITKRQAATLADLEAAEERARQRVYDFAPHGDARLSECLQLATDAARDSYQGAVATVIAYQQLLVTDCRAYRDASGRFTLNN